MAGIFKLKSGRFRAMFDHRGTRHYLGVYASEREAEDALGLARKQAASGEYPPPRPIGPKTAYDAFAEQYNYDPETGAFTRKRHPRGVRKAVAGCLTDRGYLRISLNDRAYLAHRVAWLLTTGAWPVGGHVDHINGDRADNRLCNLRIATPVQNQWNRRKNGNSASPFKGVWRGNGRKTWQAKITVNGQQKHIGCFTTAEDAHAAYLAAAREHFADFARSE